MGTKPKRAERVAGLTEASLGKTYSLKRVEEAELRSGREHNGSCRCGKVVVEEQEAVQCDWCNEWFHRKCAGVSESDFEVI